MSEVPYVARAGACRHCGSPLADGANFCPRCGAPVKPTVSALQTCVIVPWKGYRSFEFCAVLLEDGREIARSAGFRQRGSVPSESGEARAAHSELVRRLGEAGWERQEQADGSPWYETHFVRPIPAEDAQRAGRPEGERQLFSMEGGLSAVGRPYEHADPPGDRVPEGLVPDPDAEPIAVFPFATRTPRAAAVHPSAPHPAEDHAAVDVPLPSEATKPPVAETMPAAPAARLLAETPPPDDAGRHARLGRLVALVGLPVAVAFAIVLALTGFGSGRTASSSSGAATGAPRPAAATPAAPATTPARAKKLAAAAPARASSHAVKRPPVVLTLAALAGRSGSWVELRRGSAQGRVLYAGELAPGRSVHFAARSIWARFGSAGNLALTMNGRRYELFGTLDVVFTRTGPHPPRPRGA